MANPGSLLARLRLADGRALEIRSPLPGRVLRTIVEEGQSVKEGEPLMELAPASDQAWESLRALVMVGRPEDLPEVERFSLTLAPGGVDEKIRKQVALTTRAIRSRS